MKHLTLMLLIWVLSLGAVVWWYDTTASFSKAEVRAAFNERDSAFLSVARRLEAIEARLNEITQSCLGR